MLADGLAASIGAILCWLAVHGVAFAIQLVVLNELQNCK